MKHKNENELRTNIHNFINDYKTEHPWGFNTSELKDVISNFPDVDMEIFNEEMMGNTGVINTDGDFVTYHCDVIRALFCGMRHRKSNSVEWD